MASTAVPTRLPVRPGRLVLSTGQILLPATAAIIGLGYFGHLTTVPAVSAWLLAAAASGLLAWNRERRLGATRLYLTQLTEAREPRTPPNFGPLIDDGLDSAFRRLARALAERREQALEADRLLGALLEALPDPLLLVVAGHTVVRANRSAATLFGHDPVDKPLEATIRDPGVLGAVDGALQDKGDAQVTLHLPGTTPRAFAVHVVAVRLRGAPAALVSLRELTEQVMIERMRSDFIANASHEMRTPLAALTGFIETLRGPARDDEAARDRFLETMAAEASRMSRLIDDLLSLSRIESAAHQPPEGEVDLAECAAAVIEALQSYAGQRGATLELVSGDEPAPVRGDRDQLTQLLTNLVDNAIKYGDEGTSVTIAIERLDAAPPGAGPLTGRPAARLTVADDGPGIPREHLPRITERFFRVDAGRSRKLGGTGLGLAIVKHIVRRHRGHLAIDSELGEGTTVVVYLPWRQR